jgi:hypothetical protein
MRLVAPIALKGTRTPLEAARFLARPGDRLLPLSDGGDGFLDCLHDGHFGCRGKGWERAAECFDTVHFEVESDG